ncbi:MAG: DUF1616 domain-containing protein [Candidatus Methanomethylicaceae archaeon]
MIDEEVRAVVLAVVVLAGLVAVSQAITAGRVVEPFSALGTLGPNMKIGDYPKEVLAGDPFRLYLYVENHEGKAMYYRVLAKVGDNSTLVNETVPADLPVLASYDVILCHGENSTIPADIALSVPAQDAKLIFELWAVDEGGAWNYTGRWNHLWMNVTSPP